MLSIERSRGLDRLATLSYRQPAEIAQAYSRLVPLRSFRSLVAERQCLHQLGSLQLPRLKLTSCAATPHRLAVDAGEHLFLVLSLAGLTQMEVGLSGAVFCEAGGAALLPAQELRSEGCHRLAVVSIQPAAVAAAAAAMAGIDGCTLRQEQAFGQFPPLALSPAEPAARALHSLLGSIGHCLDHGPGLAQRLGLDDVILRSVACLLQPELLLENHRRAVYSRRGKQQFEALLDYIRANLDKPLRLSDLEALSHYSRRALQYAFQKRLGTTPKQWIRRQRLQQAMAELSQPRPGQSIGEVALACGYRRAGHFSREFERLFGCRPSEVRRLPG